MQESLFASNTTVSEEEKLSEASTKVAVQPADPNIRYKGYISKQDCIRHILTEEYLWDMRCWSKARNLYTKAEVIDQINQWLKDKEEGRWTYNCGHCVSCIEILLEMNWTTPEEVAGFVMQNTKIKYANEIGTWNDGGLGLDEEDGI